MAEVIKCYCPKIRQYFCLETAKVGAVYKVKNMTLLDDKTAKLVQTNIKQNKIETMDNLLPCKYNKSRVICSSKDVEKNTKCEKGKYNFQCIYCDKLQVDYSALSYSDVSGYTGKEVIVGQNQVVKISDLAPKGEKIKEVRIAGGWDPSKSGDNFDIDFSVFMQFEGRNNELVYYGEKQDRSCSVYHYGDNLTGHDGVINTGTQDDEAIRVNLEKVPKSCKKLYFLVNLYHCADRGQTFNDIKNLYVRMYDADTKRALLSYTMGQNNGSATAVIIATMERMNGEWQFKAIGDFNKCTSVNELSDRCFSRRW